MDEFYRKLFDKKFDPYIAVEKRAEFAELLIPAICLVRPDRPIVASRDPKDDKFLEAAIAADASLIVTGDRDLLVLDPFRGIRIMTPGEFLRRFGEGRN